MPAQKYDIGMVGLGVMGRNLLLNMADHGYSVAGYDRDSDKVEALRKESEDRDIHGADSMEEFISLLRKPRSVMMLVPAGPPVDSVIRDVLPHLNAGDLVIDGGNSYFEDTNLRNETLAGKDIRYLGVGISGGSHGARYGPSMMPGGSMEAYERVRPIFEATAAEVDGEPCVTYLGPGSAGHYVKMVHNGIEYGLMQMIAETYDLMKRGMELSDDEMGDVYERWNGTELNGYLVEITSHIFRQADKRTGKRLIDVILDEAKQKGTGMWTSQDSLKLQVPTPTTDIAVVMRNLSVFEDERVAASKVLGGPPHKIEPAGDRETFLERLRNALYAGMILAFTQGMALLRRASQEYEYDLHLEDVARIWRGGCIIRAALLEEIRSAFHKRPDMPNLLLDPYLGKKVKERQSDLRFVVKAAIESGIPAQGLMVSLGYFDGYRSAWLPANLIQAQRDYFGSHTYERVDVKGFFHTKWEKE